ncbi:CapA family protein [Demequina sp. SO4-13]|uniref:CapA family protein n=1 Tax=Demequina sp. SO4-13 TaxID=3401027 RepID=UPI003AF632E7
MPSHSRRSPSALPALAISIIAGVILVVAGLVATGALTSPSGGTPEASAEASEAPSAAPAATASALPSPTPAAPEPPPTVEFTLVTGGDILTHGPVLTSARAAGDGDYDFAPLMQNVRPYVEGADLALCHLEVPVAPPGSEPSGYPVFGAPAELIPALADEGWDGCSTASNHSMDRRYAGLETTLDALDEARLGHAGMARTEEEAASTQMYSVRVEDRRITVANISFTYGLNGLPKPDGMPWAVDTFDADAQDVSPIIAAAQAARDEGADIVIASTHCCVEYQTEPNAAQRDIAQQIAESGVVDLYVGHHAHVPQPIERLEGGVADDGMWAYFGHGNYLSNQDTQCCSADTNSGYLGVTTFTVAPDGDVDVTAEWVATTVDRTNRHTMHVLKDIADAGAGDLSAAEAQARHSRVADAAGDEAAERTAPPEALADAAFRITRWWEPSS